LGTFSAMQILFKTGSTVDPAERKITVRLAPRPPRVQDRDLAAARDQANRLIGEPVSIKWESQSWTVTRDELAALLPYPAGRGGMSAYLTRDALLARATSVAREVERLPSWPKDSSGKPRQVDIPSTASSLWLQASTIPTNRIAEVVLEP